MSPTTLLSAVADYAIKATAIIAIALLIDVMMKRANASLKKRVWLIAIIALLLLPLVSGLLPQLNIPILKPFGYSSYNLDGIDPALLGSLDDMPGTYWTSENSAIAILGIYLAGVLLCIAWQLIGRAYAAILRFRSRPLASEAVKQAVHSSRATFNLSDHIDVLQSSIAKAPFSTGIFNPAIIFPDSSEEWPEDVIETVVTHELVHIKRRDLAMRSLAQIACSLNWFNPLVWYALRKLHMEQEITCDDYVLNSGMKPSEYAEHLLAIAEIRHGKLSYALASMGHHGELKDRLLEILKPRRSKSPVRGLTSALLLLAAVLLLTPVFLVNLWDINSSVTAQEDLKSKGLQEKKASTSTNKVAESKSAGKKEVEHVSKSDQFKMSISKKMVAMQNSGISQKKMDAYLSDAKAKLEKLQKQEKISAKQKAKEKAAIENNKKSQQKKSGSNQ